LNFEYYSENVFDVTFQSIIQESSLRDHGKPRNFSDITVGNSGEIRTQLLLNTSTEFHCCTNPLRKDYENLTTKSGPVN
jgi:hypothetical protein